MTVLDHILTGTSPLAASLASLLSPSLMPSPVDEATSVLASAEARILGVTLAHLAAETKRNADAVVSINENLHILTRLEQAHGNVLDRLKEGSIKMSDHEDRIQRVEKVLPGLLEMRKWVIGGVMAGIGMIGVALMKLVILDVPRIPGYGPLSAQQQPQQAPPQPLQAPQTAPQPRQ